MVCCVTSAAGSAEAARSTRQNHMLRCTREVMEEHDLLRGVQTVMTLWQWSELFLQNGFRLASVSARSLERVWRIETNANEGGFPWYSGAAAMRFCFYTKTHPGPESKASR